MPLRSAQRLAFQAWVREPRTQAPGVTSRPNTFSDLPPAPVSALRARRNSPLTPSGGSANAAVTTPRQRPSTNSNLRLLNSYRLSLARLDRPTISEASPISMTAGSSLGLERSPSSAILRWNEPQAIRSP